MNKLILVAYLLKHRLDDLRITIKTAIPHYSLADFEQYLGQLLPLPYSELKGVAQSHMHLSMLLKPYCKNLLMPIEVP